MCSLCRGRGGKLYNFFINYPLSLTHKHVRCILNDIIDTKEHHYQFHPASLSINSQDFESPHFSPGSLSPYYCTPPCSSRTRKVKSRLHHHRRHTSDLSYDAVSYSHNFEDTGEVWRFTSRLPVSPWGEEITRLM